MKAIFEPVVKVCSSLHPEEHKPLNVSVGGNQSGFRTDPSD